MEAGFPATLHQLSPSGLNTTAYLPPTWRCHERSTLKKKRGAGKGKGSICRQNNIQSPSVRVGVSGAETANHQTSLQCLCSDEFFFFFAQSILGGGGTFAFPSA